MRYVAFLRAVNVGGRVVKMDRLRAIFEAQRFTNVSTVIASGNVLFDTRSTDAAALEHRIERALAKELGYDVATFLRAPAELAAAVALEPFDDVDGCTVSVAFFKSTPAGDAAERLRRLSSDDDTLHLQGRELYWRCRGRTSDSTVWRTPLEKVIGAPATVRNVTTVRKLAGMVADIERSSRQKREY